MQGWYSFVVMLLDFQENFEASSKPCFPRREISSSALPNQNEGYGDLLKSSKIQQRPIFRWKSKRLKQSFTQVPENQCKSQHWVIKNFDVKQEDFSKMWLVTKLFEFHDWAEIEKTLKIYFNS